MAQQKRKLPNRKWYSLEQAAEKLTREFNELVTINDLLHFYICKKLDLSVYIRRYPATITIGSLVFSDYKRDEKTLKKEDVKFDVFCENDKEVDCETFHMEQGFRFSYLDDIYITEEEYKHAYEYLFIYGFMYFSYVTQHNPDEEKSILNNGFRINKKSNYLVFYDKNNGNDTLIWFLAKTDKDVFLPLSDFYILESDLLNFIHGKDNRKAIEDIVKKSGRPTPHKETIIELAQNIFNAYPENNRESIAKAVLSLVNDYNYLNVKNYQTTIETIRAYLRENNIGKYRGKSIKINKLERFKK